MAKRNAARKMPSHARKPRESRKGKPMPPGAGGKRRSEHEVQDLVHQTYTAMYIYEGQTRTTIARALGAFMHMRGWQSDDTPMPLNTVDDYMARAAALRAEEQQLDRDQLRAQQSRRLTWRMMRADAENRHGDAIKIERLKMDLDGTAAPKQIIASTPPGQPLEVRVREPELMTTGERRRMLEQLEAEDKAAEAALAAQQAASAAAAPEPSAPSAPPPAPEVAAASPDPTTPPPPSPSWRTE